MQWTMPLRTRQIVAGLIGLSALTAFVLGIVNAPSRGRLPGEKAAESGGSAAAIQATEATPLSQDRFEGPPSPAPLTDEQKAALEAEKLAKAEAEAAPRPAATPGQPAAPAAAAAPPPTPTPTLQQPTLAQEQPVF
jgi:hypothetical protein